MSVIIPFYNRERFLPRAINSVLRQTRQDWELILVDDGSVDGSNAVASKFAGTHPERIKLVTQENRGRGMACNRGITESKGDLVAFLDSDDEWKPEFLAKMVGGFEACSTADWICCDATRIQDDDGTIVEPSVLDSPSGSDLRALETEACGPIRLIVDDRFLLTAIRSSIKAGANSLIKRRVLNHVQFPSGRGIANEDRVLAISAIVAGYRFGYLHEVLLLVYHHAENVSMNTHGTAQRDLQIRTGLIRGYSEILRRVPLEGRESRALNEVMSNIELEAARSAYHAGASPVEVIGHLLKAVRRNPLNDRVFRTLLRVLTGRNG